MYGCLQLHDYVFHLHPQELHSFQSIENVDRELKGKIFRICVAEVFPWVISEPAFIYAYRDFLILFE